MQATLRPLRQLADSAREVARGNYRERVAADSPDEVGALGREFNAMAAALAEREQRLRRSEQLATVGKMAAQITHEVRNPLTSIGLNAELLAEEFTGQDREAHKLAKAIVREVDRLTDITEQYLRFARLPEPRFEPTSVSELSAQPAAISGRRAAGARGDGGGGSWTRRLPQVPLDDNQVRQTALNLVRNAAEAMTECPPGERVLTVRSRQQAEDAWWRARRASLLARSAVRRSPSTSSTAAPASGAEHLRQIFEPFFHDQKRRYRSWAGAGPGSGRPPWWTALGA